MPRSRLNTRGISCKSLILLKVSCCYKSGFSVDVELYGEPLEKGLFIECTNTVGNLAKLLHFRSIK